MAIVIWQYLQVHLRQLSQVTLQTSFTLFLKLLAPIAFLHFLPTPLFPRTIASVFAHCFSNFEQVDHFLQFLFSVITVGNSSSHTVRKLFYCNCKWNCKSPESIIRSLNSYLDMHKPSVYLQKNRLSAMSSKQQYKTGSICFCKVPFSINDKKFNPSFNMILNLNMLSVSSKSD